MPEAGSVAGAVGAAGHIVQAEVGLGHRAFVFVAAAGASLFLNIGTTMEAVALALLQHRGLRVITAESCTGGLLAGSLAKDYVAKHGAAVMMTKLARDAEFRADEAAGIYLARGGSNPLALYSVLQKMTALGASSPALAQLYRTHPALDTRMDRIDQRAYAGLEAYTKR